MYKEVCISMECADHLGNAEQLTCGTAEQVARGRVWWRTGWRVGGSSCVDDEGGGGVLRGSGGMWRCAG